MHLWNSCTRSTSSWYMRRVPSASFGFGLGMSLSSRRYGDLLARLLLAEERPQLARGLGQRRGTQLDLTVAQPRDDVLLAPIRVRLRVVVARMATAALLAEQRRPRHRLGAEQRRPQVER